jgi:hypothetical protein
MSFELRAGQRGAAPQRVGLCGTERGCIRRTIGSATAFGCVHIGRTLLYIGGYRSHARHGDPFLL